MTPHLTARGLMVLTTACALLGAGVWASVLGLILLSSALLAALLVVTLLATMRQWASEAGEIAATVSVTVPSNGIRRGEAFDLDVVLEHRGQVGWGRSTVEACGPACIEVDPDRVHLAMVRGATSTRLRLTLKASRSGTWRLWGLRVRVEDLLGLARVTLWLPATTVIEVLPARMPLSLPPVRAPQQRLAQDVLGAHRRRRGGQSTEVRELRDYQPGDPWRRIAWSASARRGALQVREFEAEEAREVLLFLDVSATLRTGPDGAAFELALDVAAASAELLIAARDRVGLVTFMHEVHRVSPPGAGRRQRRLLTEHLLALNAVLPEQFCGLGEGEVKTLVSRFLALQERLDFRTRRGAVASGAATVDEALLERWLAVELERHREDPRWAPLLRREPDGLSAARRYAWRQNMEFPARASDGVARERSWERAFARGLEVSRRARDWTVITDLSDVESPERLAGVAGRMQEAGRRLDVIVIDTPSALLVEPVQGPTLEAGFAWAERRERALAVRALRARGVPVRVLHVGDAPWASSRRRVG